MTDIRTTAKLGRPREFDVDEALEQAVLVFWEHGFEGASLTDLTTAMGISRKSMYAAFGNKEELFRKALQRYSEGPGAYAARALEQPTALAVATSFLNGCLYSSTKPTRPPGCLYVKGQLTAGEPGGPVDRAVTADRDEGFAGLRARFQRAVDEGDLPPETDACQLARYVVTVANGLCVQASGGVRRDELQPVVDAALRNWPPL
ncbi:TetR/AcrR family transcriptional regulator [Lentzea sp. NPDC059081]|uniref:TetR/AcrR family transcriptional regulator n=1 Tax=Lentzea sp. NPDC059081 TaxID=3346719 RepID=UPI00369022EB